MGNSASATQALQAYSSALGMRDRVQFTEVPIDPRTIPRDDALRILSDQQIIKKFRDWCDIPSSGGNIAAWTKNEKACWMETLKDLIFEVVQHRPELGFGKAQGQALACRQIAQWNRAQIMSVPNSIMEQILGYVASAAPVDTTRKYAWCERDESLYRTQTGKGLIASMLTIAGKDNQEAIYRAYGKARLQVLDRYNNFTLTGSKNLHKIRKLKINCSLAVEAVDDFVPIEQTAKAIVHPTLAELDVLFTEDKRSRGTDFSPFEIEIDTWRVCENEAMTIIVLQNLYLSLAKHRKSERLSRLGALSIKTIRHWCRTCHGHHCYLKDPTDAQFHHSRPRDIHVHLLDMIDTLLQKRQSPLPPPEDEREPIMVPWTPANVQVQNNPAHNNFAALPNVPPVNQGANNMAAGNFAAVPPLVPGANGQAGIPPLNNVPANNVAVAPIMIPGGSWDGNPFGFGEEYSWSPKAIRKYLRKPEMLAPGELKVGRVAQLSDHKRKREIDDVDGPGRATKRQALNPNSSQGSLFGSNSTVSDVEDAHVKARYEQDDEEIKPRFFPIGVFDKAAFDVAWNNLRLYFRDEYHPLRELGIVERPRDFTDNLEMAKAFADNSMQ